jgi:hypothetical protein
MKTCEFLKKRCHEDRQIRNYPLYDKQQSMRKQTNENSINKKSFISEGLGKPS